MGAVLFDSGEIKTHGLNIMDSVDASYQRQRRSMLWKMRNKETVALIKWKGGELKKNKKKKNLEEIKPLRGKTGTDEDGANWRSELHLDFNLFYRKGCSHWNYLACRVGSKIPDILHSLRNSAVRKMNVIKMVIVLSRTGFLYVLYQCLIREFMIAVLHLCCHILTPVFHHVRFKQIISGWVTSVSKLSTACSIVGFHKLLGNRH